MRSQRVTAREVFPDYHRSLVPTIVAVIVGPSISIPRFQVECPRRGSRGVPLTIGVGWGRAIDLIAVCHDEISCQRERREKRSGRRGPFEKRGGREGTRSLSILRPQG